jgi:hypothetical protein
MRSVSLIIPFLLLSACGPAVAPEEAPAEAAPPAAIGTPMSTGLMGGISTSAAGNVSALTISDSQIAFTNADGEETFALPTQFIGAVEPSTLIAAGGQSFAAAAPSSTATRVEVRAIFGSTPQELCGLALATHVAILSTEPLTGVQLMVFTGGDQPGPNARDSRVCAIFAYAVD